MWKMSGMCVLVHICHGEHTHIIKRCLAGGYVCTKEALGLIWLIHSSQRRYLVFVGLDWDL